MTSAFGELTVIVNPHAGRRHVGDEVPELERNLRARGLSYRLMRTGGPGDATRMATEALRDGSRFLVAVGGDGTVHEVVNGMFEDGHPIVDDVVLGVVAAGSGCDFIRTFGLPGDATRACNHLVGENTYPLDVGRITFRASDGAERSVYFANVAEAGLGAAVTARAERMSPRLGQAKYFLGFWLVMPRFKLAQVRVQADRRTFEGPAYLVVVGNAQYYGGDPFAIVAETLDGERWAISDEARGAHVLALPRARPGLELEPLETALPLLRAVKDEDELERLRAAARSADAAFADVVELGFAGRTELQLAADLDRLLREHGHERVGFTIVGSGPNAASSHHDSGERRIERGDAVVMDFGGVLDGYWSDLTRTVFVGEPTAEQREVYEVVREAQRSAFDAIRPGVTCEAVDRAARSVIEAAGYHERFVHRTGHGIGLDLHEPPYIVEGNETVLQAGMTFSDEPGIYLEGRFGVRIEDQVAVTATGAERLNEASREITIVG